MLLINMYVVILPLPYLFYVSANIEILFKSGNSFLVFRLQLRSKRTTRTSPYGEPNLTVGSASSEFKQLLRKGYVILLNH